MAVQKPHSPGVKKLEAVVFSTSVSAKMKILSLITHPPHFISKAVRLSFIFGTQIKIVLMKSKSLVTHRQQGSLNIQKAIIKTVHVPSVVQL